MSPELRQRLRALLEKGSIAGQRIILVDPDSPRRYRNVYEDLDQETPTATRFILLTLYPEYEKAKELGYDGEAEQVLTMEQAIKDIRRMLKLGYKVSTIMRDRDAQ